MNKDESVLNRLSTTSPYSNPRFFQWARLIVTASESAAYGLAASHSAIGICSPLSSR